MTNPPLEQEVKFYILDLSSLEERLHSLGAVLITPRTFERNLRFDTPDKRLTTSNQALRLRQDAAVHITYKGPASEKQGVRVRPEIEFVVSDFDQAQLFLEALGYLPVAVYEKWRTTYRLNGLEITLDELPYGHFSEIEGEDTGVIRSTSTHLALSWDARIADSYLGLFEGLKRKLHLPVENLTFPEFKDLSVNAQDLGVIPADYPRFL